MLDVISIASLLVIFQIKHFVADYPLQTPYMLGKFKPFPQFIWPLAAHAGVHTIFTVVIALAYQRYDLVMSLALLDFTTHFVIDRLKASPALLGRFKPDQKQFWWALGFDQMAHQFVMILCVLILMGG
jgi:hypothetical protein